MECIFHHSISLNKTSIKWCLRGAMQNCDVASEAPATAVQFELRPVPECLFAILRIIPKRRCRPHESAETKTHYLSFSSG